ncbi:MAG TPA: sterol desaturase family protein [Verrucomicrobiae bacterium]|nr:sterol desaturase family protein [Verrucomicrobiae bacterium]
MVHNKYDYQIFVFLSLVLVFELWERLRPARQGDRWGQLKLDVLSFVFAIIANRICTGVIANCTGGHVGWISAIPAKLEKLPLVVRIGFAILLVDFIIYWIHRAQHRFAILWRTHAWHHSPEHLYWLSGFRTSLLHSFINNIPQVVVPIAIFRLTPFESAIGYSLGICIQFWEHTNLKVNIGALEWIFITPDYHRVHHSATNKVGKNLGTTFTFWDRMFGTFVDPRSFPEQFPLGLGAEIKARDIPRMMVGV